jgi:hypothetical protein
MSNRATSGTTSLRGRREEGGDVKAVKQTMKGWGGRWVNYTAFEEGARACFRWGNKDDLPATTVRAFWGGGWGGSGATLKRKLVSNTKG